MKAQKIVDQFKAKGWLKSSSNNYCYESTNNKKVTNLFYASAPDTTETKDGYFFVFDDKSSVEFDGKLFIVNDQTQTEYKMNLSAH